MTGYRFFIVIFFLLASFRGNSQLTYNPDIPWSKKEFKEFYKVYEVQNIGISESAFIERYINNQISFRDFLFDYNILSEAYRLDYIYDRTSEISSDCISHITLLDTSLTKILTRSYTSYSDINIIPQRLGYLEFAITSIFKNNEVESNDFRDKVRNYNVNELVKDMEIIEGSLRSSKNDKLITSYVNPHGSYFELDNKNRVIRIFRYNDFLTIPNTAWTDKDLLALQRYCNDSSLYPNQKKGNPFAAMVSICEESFDQALSFLSFLTYELR